MTHAVTHHRHTSHLVQPGLLRRLWLGLTARRQRQHLARLDDNALNDIGLTREDVRREASRPVWDVPAHWLER